MSFSSRFSHCNRIGQVIKDMGNATSSCCEYINHYSSHKNQGIFNKIILLYFKHIIKISKIIIYLSEKTLESSN